jgi:hypothetical protein
VRKPQHNVCPCSVAVEIEDPVQITGFEAIVPTRLPFAGGDLATMADFTGDGCADLFIHNAAGGMRIATAADVNNLSAGLTWGPELTWVLPNAALGYIAFAIGDFRGDGQRQIAVAINPPDITGVMLTLYTVDPDSLTIASYAFSTKETAEAKVSYGIPDVASVSVDLKTAAKQAHGTTVATAFNTYSGVTSNLSATSGFADHLFFTQTRFNIYYYPVIGQMVCPAAKPTCPEDEKLPLHVQFSGPDTVTQTDIDAATQEWYQPVWEPGNLFSYPWNLTLLQQAFPNLTPLTTNPAPWRGTDTSTSAYATTWTEGSGASQSSGSVSSHSTDVSVTVAAKASIEGFAIDGSAGFEVNSSQSVSTLNTSAQTLSASTGIQVNKPDCGDIVADNYLYDFGGYIFGQSPPTGTVQTIPLEDAQGDPIAIQATGPQLTTATAGDQLRLQARVYNYSLVDMPTGTQADVRFYGQVYDNGNLVGNSFLIGEDVIGPIPGFNSTSTNGEAPNWTLAGTTFDTTGRANQYLIFWVLVWMLAGDGNLLPELEDHGLTQNPAPLSFAQITDVPTEPYSNNVGFYGYNSPFYVAAPDSALAGPPVQEGDLIIDRLSIPTTPILLDGKTKISAHLSTEDTHLGSLLVAFYDGDPPPAWQYPRRWRHAWSARWWRPRMLLNTLSIASR